MEATYDNPAGNEPVAGLQGGLQTTERDRWGHALADARPCETCTRPFRPSRKDDDRRRVRFCSIGCRAIARRGQVPACVERFITPPSTKAERVRANGLVNKRVKLGHFTLPATCQKCGEPAKTETHHPDYSQPGKVLALCRSCHMQCHQRPEDFAHLTPFDTERVGPMPRRHSKGGRKGPTGKAKGRAPLRRIIGTYIKPITRELVEMLDCRHVHVREDDGRRPVQRRCLACPAAPSRSEVARG